ncbi:MAG: NAD(P)/FAD-dependent oxidoreductase [Firmicutes bacterium]|nr:NAD(P)/FAD-dependent oxidoreductase [Bacillota bacterium]
MMKYDLVIAGGGAAGLAAAASFIKELNKGEGEGSGDENSPVSVCVLEKNSAPGRKINATGGGRCNLTNEACPGKDMTIDFFRSIGIETWRDNEGRYYPYTNKASDVTKALTDAVRGADVKCGFTVKVISRIKAAEADGSEAGTESGGMGNFMITGMVQEEPDKAPSMEMIFADRVIMAMGGKAGPQYGTTGDGYTIARTLGHDVTRVFPILTGIECEADGVDFAALKGVRAKGTVVLNKDGNPIVRDTGEIQFTEDGISGICVFNLTPHIKADKREKFEEALKRYTVTVDLAPDFTEEQLSSRGSSFGIITEKLAAALDGTDIKNWQLNITGIKGWRDAQATFGGVALDEIDMDTMESRLVPGLYFAGEIIDAQGPCGGFNLQNAWETGIKAARAIAGADK